MDLWAEGVEVGSPELAKRNGSVRLPDRVLGPDPGFNQPLLPGSTWQNVHQQIFFLLNIRFCFSLFI